MTTPALSPVRPEPELYQGETAGLLRALDAELATLPRGKWARRRLASGVVVALRRHPQRDEYNLSFVRQRTPSRLVEQAQWEAEVAGLQIALGARDWGRGDDVHRTEGGVAAAFTTVADLQAIARANPNLTRGSAP